MLGHRRMAKDLGVPLGPETVALAVTSICCLRMAIFWALQPPERTGFESMWRVLCEIAWDYGVLLLPLSRVPYCVRQRLGRDYRCIISECPLSNCYHHHSLLQLSHDIKSGFCKLECAGA